MLFFMEGLVFVGEQLMSCYYFMYEPVYRRNGGLKHDVCSEKNV